MKYQFHTKLSKAECINRLNGHFRSDNTLSNLAANVINDQYTFVGSVNGDNFLVHGEAPLSSQFNFARPNIHVLPKTFRGVLVEDESGTTIYGSNRPNRSFIFLLVALGCILALLSYAIVLDPYTLIYVILGCIFYYGLMALRYWLAKKSGAILKHRNINFITNLLEAKEVKQN